MHEAELLLRLSEGGVHQVPIARIRLAPRKGDLSGVVTQRGGTATGARPGRLVRGAQGRLQ